MDELIGGELASKRPGASRTPSRSSIGAARQADSLDQFLEEVSLVADADEVDGDTSKVTLMTLHTAKGLEYPVVFLLGLEDGVFPHLRSLGRAG